MPAIRLVTEIPGPHSRALMARRQAAVPRGVFHATPVFVRAAHGAIVEDVDGNRFLDFAGGIGAMNVGHTAPPVVAAVKAQIDCFTHTAFSVAAYEGYISLAERLASLTPGTFAKKTLFVNSGAEAVENAVKIARYATGRPAVMCFEDAFHGRTLLTMSLTSKVDPYKRGFGPMASEVVRVPYAYCYRCPYGRDYSDCATACLTVIADHFKRYADPATIAAVVVEPVLGEGGFVVPPAEFLSGLAALCREHGILVIADEVQSGMGRTGRLFASEHFDFVPDILVTAKSIAGGLPLAAVVGRADVMDAPGVGSLGSTFGGNPLAMAAAHAVLDMFDESPLLPRAEVIGARIAQRAVRWAAACDLVGDVRRLGAMAAVELVRDRVTREPAREETTRLLQRVAEGGVLMIGAGTYGNVVRVLVPLVVSDDELDEGLDVIESALGKVSA
jgi:4-aminobutyrate aminotransferase/(S)-3-amino-2-methylpropionate transaminase